MTASQPDARESWRAESTDATTLDLRIPAHLRRERRFEIACTLTARPRREAPPATIELRLIADGDLQWSRKITTRADLAFDGLDYRFQRSVPVGRALLLQARARLDGAQLQRILIEAEEC